jgi:DNA repair exonuclease SbcCD ATPase subunit
MRILKFHEENIKRIVYVEITPTGDVITIEGKNKAGKSSVLDGIAYLICGKKLIPPGVVRKGEKEGFVSADIGDYIITRIFHADGSSVLKIKGKDGTFSPANPQTFLNDILGCGGKNELAYDPTLLMTLDKAKRIEVFKSITGLDFKDIEERRKHLFDSRRETNRDLSKATGEIGQYSNLPELKTVRTLDVVQKEYEAVWNHNKELKDALARTEEIKNGLEEADAAIKDWTARIAEIKAEKTKLLPATRRKEKDILKIETELNEVKNNSGLEYKIKRKRELDTEVAKFKCDVETIEREMAGLDERKTKMIEDAKLPVKGMAITDDDIQIDGIDFENCSQAQQIEVSMAIRMAQKPKLKVILVRQGSLLDKDSKKNIEIIAAKNGFQIWLESVADKPSGDTVFIEEGKVK